MGRFLAGVVSALLLTLAGIFVWQGIARDEPKPVPPAPSAPPDDPASAPPPPGVGPPPPEATELTREERRFARYDRDRDGTITRTEMLSTRTPSFRRLDVNGDNYLTFNEWAVSTAERFAGADADGSGTLTAAEFATTRQRRSTPRTRCNC